MLVFLFFFCRSHAMKKIEMDDVLMDQEFKDDIVNKVFKELVTSAKVPSKVHHKKRRTICELPANFFGPVPNIPVGTSWQYRLQVGGCGECTYARRYKVLQSASPKIMFSYFRSAKLEFIDQ